MSLRDFNQESNRGPRRSPSEKGLPDEVALRELALVYLDYQHRLWPDLAQSGALPPNTAEAVAELAEDFRQRFLGSKQVLLDVSQPSGVDLACAYDRYSDLNSNPRSLAQQLGLQLERAAANRHFIPWHFVFADAAVTGTITDRRGYQMAKEVISGFSDVAVMYIDEIGRASRDSIEALTLGKMIQGYGKRLIGVSDGFDTNNPTWKMMLHVFAMLQEWFVDQLREKVKRGMDYGFATRANLQPPPFGYRLLPRNDDQGRPMKGADGAQLMGRVIDPNHQPFIVRAYKLFVNRGRSPERIAAIFNRFKVGGIECWNAARIRRLLRRYSHVGIEVYRMTRLVRVEDPDTKKTKLKTDKRPRKEWRVRRMRHLQMVPYSLWKKAQRRLKSGHDAWHEKRPNGVKRHDVYPTLLIRPICGCCGHVMYLGSSGKYSTYFCPNGNSDANGCSFRGYKSVRMVETSVLRFVLENVLTAEIAGKLTAAVNQYLVDFSKEPSEDLTPVRYQLKDVRRKLKNLYSLVENKGIFPGAEVRIGKLEREKGELQRRLQEAEQRNAPPPKSLVAEEVLPLLQQAAELLNQDVARAAPVLSQLTGAIELHPTGKKQGNRHVWEAKFTMNLAPVCLELSRALQLPTKGTWEFLNDRSWKFESRAEVVVVEIPEYELIATEVAAALKAGISKNALALKLGVNWSTIDEALEFAATGKRPAPKPTGQKTGKPKRIPLVERHGPEILRRRDLNQSFDSIARNLKINPASARRIFDQLRPEAINEAIAKGEKPNRGKYSHIPPEKFEEIRALLKQGVPIKDIAQKVGVSYNTVLREKCKMVARTQGSDN
jgi:DNA invertase Pin-like site-specific DNA recombinase